MNEPAILKHMHPSTIGVYRAVARAARHGKMCPTNRELQDQLGFASQSSPSEALRTLERAGLIEVTRYQASRRVRIVHTGQETLDTWHQKTPHWSAK